MIMSKNLPMSLMPNAPGLRLESFAIDAESVSLSVSSTYPSATCPTCGRRTARLHSHYRRTLADLPWAGRSVRLSLSVRRFRCAEPACSRRIFAERLPTLVEPYARKTARLNEVLELVGFALGGEAGARLAKRLALKVSPSTLLRLLRGAKVSSFPAPTVIGVDDFAFLKGRSYGTIIVDLERHRPVEMLPDRSAEALAVWLKKHPEVATISRDRSTEYERAIKEGAPQATEVLDRWHLLKNLREVTQRMLERDWKNISGALVDPAGKTLEELPPLPRGVFDRMASEADRKKRLERYGQVRELHARGLGILTISRMLGMSRGAVRKYVRSEDFPERPRHPRRPSMLDPFEPYLLERWEEGCRNALQLYREIKKRGYPGGRGIVLRWARRRREKPAPSTPGRYLSQVAERCKMQSVSRPSKKQKPRFAAKDGLALSGASGRPRRGRGTLPQTDDRMFAPHRQGLPTRAALQEALVKEKAAEDFGKWMADALQSSLADFESFAAGLGREREAVEAALKQPWSNGQVEGHISRLKFIKRQMYGRASFELLRRRVLNAA